MTTALQSSSNAKTSAVASSLDLTLPSGIALGDRLYIVAYSRHSTASIPTPTGYSEMFSRPGVSGFIGGWWKDADGTEADLTLTLSTGTHHIQAIMVRLDGHLAGSVPTVSNISPGATGTDWTSPSVTAPDTGLALFGGAASTASDFVTNDEPDTTTLITQNSTALTWLGMAWETISAAGAIGSRTWTNQDGGKRAFTIFTQDAVGGGGGGGIPWTDGEAPTSLTGYQHVELIPASMDGATVGYALMLPEPYYSDPAYIGRTYPVCIWMHGKGGNENSLVFSATSSPGIWYRAYIDAGGVPFILVMPNGGDHSFYYPAQTGSTEDGKDVETFIVSTLLSELAANFKADITTVMLGGFSMGANGAFRLFAKYPGTFKCVAGYGPPMPEDFATFGTNDQPTIDDFLYGAPGQALWEAENPRAVYNATLATTLVTTGGSCRLRYGSSDPVRNQGQTWGGSSDNIVAQCTEAGIPLDYAELAGIAHNQGDYFTAEGYQVFTWLMNASGYEVPGTGGGGGTIEEPSYYPMSLLEIIQQCCRTTGLPVPSTVNSLTDEKVVRLMALLNELCTDLVYRVTLQDLIKEASFYTVAAETQGKLFDLAGPDCLAILGNTIWNRTKQLPLFGPLTPTEWATIKASGFIGPMNSYRLRGAKLLFDTIPTAGEVCTFEYKSKYIAYNPVDQEFKEFFSKDTDHPIVPDVLLLAGLRMKWKMEKGLEYAELFRMYELLLGQCKLNSEPGRMVDLSCPNSPTTLPRPGVVLPLGGYIVAAP